jgi:hypothetical protein
MGDAMTHMHISFILLLCLNTSAMAAESSSPLKRGSLIGGYLNQLEKHGRSKPVNESDPKLRGMRERGRWKIGDGFLEIEMSISAGIITDILYAINSEEGKNGTTLTVKEVDLPRCEMTVTIPPGAAIDLGNAKNLKTGEIIGDHSRELEQYVKVRSFLTTKEPWAYSISMWKIGDGYLAIDSSVMTGTILKMRYIIGDEQNRTTLAAKEVDLAKGEMTVIIPGTAADKAESRR